MTGIISRSQRYSDPCDLYKMLIGNGMKDSRNTMIPTTARTVLVVPSGDSSASNDVLVQLYRDSFDRCRINVGFRFGRVRNFVWMDAS